MEPFLSWWLRQLTGLLPASWRPGAASEAAARDNDDSVVLAFVPGAPGSPAGAVEATRQRRQRRVPLGRFGLDPAGLAALRTAVGSGRHGPVRLVLPPALLLEQPVSLPLQAERGLETALRWEMDRLTPFAADAVFWTWRVTERDRARGQIRLHLLLVARAAIGTVVDALTAAGLAPARLEAIGDPLRAIPVGGHRRAAPRRPALLAGVAAAALLAVAAIVVPFARQQMELDRLADDIAALRPQVDVSEVLRRRFAERAASTETVAAEAARVGDALGTLAILTDLLPDHTALFDLSLRDRIVTVSGQSTEASSLIPILAADPAVRNPVFSAPVTRNEITHTEAFAIRAEMRP